MSLLFIPPPEAMVKASNGLFCCYQFNCFDRILFNCFTRVLFNRFACVNFFACIHNLICLILAVRNIKIFLTIFLTPILFLLWDYIINIVINVRDVFEICSGLLCIHCTFLLNSINIILHVLVCVTYFCYLIIE